MRINPRRDQNEREIITTLEKCGMSVVQLNGPGLPDLLVSRHGVNLLLEVKMPGKQLTEKQREWHASWKGQVAIVENARQALEVCLG